MFGTYTSLAYNVVMEFIETSVFTRQLKGLLSDEEYRETQAFLILSPHSGDLIQGSGGLRKLRWSSKGKGKRGGVRRRFHENGTVSGFIGECPGSGTNPSRG